MIMYLRPRHARDIGIKGIRNDRIFSNSREGNNHIWLYYDMLDCD